MAAQFFSGEGAVPVSRCFAYKMRTAARRHEASSCNGGAWQASVGCAASGAVPVSRCFAYKMRTAARRHEASSCNGGAWQASVECAASGALARRNRRCGVLRGECWAALQWETAARSQNLAMDHGASYLLREDEPYVTLADRVRRIGKVILGDWPKGQLQIPAAPTRLSGDAQRLMFSIVDMIDDILNIYGRCCDVLTGANLVFTQEGRPRLVGVRLVPYSVVLAVSNYGSLANIIEFEILSACGVQIPMEVKHLLFLMRSQPLQMSYAITNHSSMIPMEKRSFMFVLEYQYLYGIMYRSPDEDAVLYIIHQILFDPDWATKIPARNYVLHGYLQRGFYDPLGTQAGTFPGLEVLRFCRNGPEHPFDDALDLTSAFATWFGRADIAHMFYANLPLVLCSLSAGLHRQGRLRYLDLRSLFTDLPKPVASPAAGFRVLRPPSPPNI